MSLTHKAYETESVAKLQLLLKDSDYKLSQFSDKKIHTFEKRIYRKELGGVNRLYMYNV